MDDLKVIKHSYVIGHPISLANIAKLSSMMIWRRMMMFAIVKILVMKQPMLHCKFLVCSSWDGRPGPLQNFNQNDDSSSCPPPRWWWGQGDGRLVVDWCRREVVLRMFAVRGRHLGEELCDAILRWGAARVRCISALMHCWMHLWNGTMHQRFMIKFESVDRKSTWMQKIVVCRHT